MIDVKSDLCFKQHNAERARVAPSQKSGIVNRRNVLAEVV